MQLFCEVAVEQRGINYHVAHVQMLLQTVREHSELHNEIYCQLIRQMRNHPQPTSQEVLQVSRPGQMLAKTKKDDVKGKSRGRGKC